MNLFQNYDQAARERLGVRYENIIADPAYYFVLLLNQYKLYEITDVDELCAKLPVNRILHIVNLYLSEGFLFEKLFNLHFSHHLRMGISYEWDLLALSHDLGYIYESETFSSDVHSINSLCKKMNLDSLFDDRCNPLFYKDSTYTNYFMYKREVFDICDHGIIGSLLLVNRFHSEELTSNALINLAYVIASHNIFSANLSSEPIYYQYNLFELIPSHTDFKRLPINCDKYAFYYLYLCMLDILEPINAFNFDDLEEQLRLLGNLSYTIGERGLEITTRNACYIERIAKRIYDIAIWMNVKMIVHSPNKLELQIK